MMNKLRSLLPILILLVLICRLSFADTRSVDHNGCYYIDWFGGCWGTIIQPSVEWRFGDGLEWDTTGSSVYRNYGDSLLTVGLTDGNRPGLTEGILAEGQSAVDLDGTNDYFTAGDEPAFDAGDGDFMICTWINISTGAGFGAIIQKATSAGSGSSAGYALYIRTSDPFVRIAISDGLSNPTSLLVTSSFPTDIRDDCWHHLACVWDGAADSSALYLDGEWCSSDIAGGTIGSLDNSAGLEVARYTGTPTFLAGKVDQLSWWNYGVSGLPANIAVQIDSLYSQCPNGSAQAPYPTIQSAILASDTGDSVRIAGGRYKETVEVASNLVIISDDISFGFRPVICGVDLLAASGVKGIYLGGTVELGYLDIRGFCSASGYGIYADSTADSTVIHHVVIDSCQTGVGFYGTAEKDSLLNCTIDGADLAGSYGVRTINANSAMNDTLFILNSVITGSAKGIEVTDSFTVVMDYNNLWNNSIDRNGISAGSHDIACPPMFRTANDYRPINRSRLLDRGINCRGSWINRTTDIGAWEVRWRNSWTGLTLERRCFRSGRMVFWR